jgi:hypothetical protein
MRNIILFACILFVSYAAVYCEDITYVVTQNSDLEIGFYFKIDVTEGDIVFYQGKTAGNAVDGYKIFVRTKQGSEGWIDANHVLLQDNQPLPDSVTDKYWIYSFYQDIIFEQKRETLYKYEPFWLNEYDDYIERDPWRADFPWWTYFSTTRLNIRNNLAYIWGILLDDALSFVFTKQDQNYATITLQAICEYKGTNHPHNYLNEIFNEGKKYQLILKIDGDYMDVFVNNETNKICTLIGVDDFFIEAVKSIVRNEEVDLTRISCPRRADGNMDYSPPSLSADAVIKAEDKNPQSYIDTEKTNAEKSSIPLWAWLAIIGVFVAVSVCTALFVVKRKK